MMKRNSGFTLIELITVIVCIGILIYISLPKFIDISDESQVAAEEEMVGHIKTGLQLYHAQTMVNTGSGSYPATLDDAEAGQSSVDNPFFTNITQNPYRGDDWQKESDTTYIGPADGTYVYNSSAGTFEKVVE